MTTLPSFVELMASLGLDKDSQSPNSSVHSCSSAASPCQVPIITTSCYHSRSSSNSSLHEMDRRTAGRHRAARYSPYSPPISIGRRGSLPCLLHDREYEEPVRPYSTSPFPPSSPCTSSAYAGVTVLESSLGHSEKLCLTDLTANTPISTYVRRRTPHTSPTLETFPRTVRTSEPLPSNASMPFSMPMLPSISPPSSLFICPPTSNTDYDRSPRDSPLYPSQALPDISEGEPLSSSYSSH